MILQLEENSNDSILCSFDICSLFTNVFLAETIEICIETLYNGHLPTPGQPQIRLGPRVILLLPQSAALPESDAGSGVIKPASSFVIQNRQTSCSMWCPMYRACC